MLKLNLNGRENPVEMISDLIKVLDELLPGDYMIAGGYVRDWYQNQPFNDIDIYPLIDCKTTIKDLIEKIKKHCQIEIVGKENKYFIEGYFLEKSKTFAWLTPMPKYKIQFIMWEYDPQGILKGYDFEHCRFFIPFKKRTTLDAKDWISQSTGALKDIPYDRVPLAFNTAVESLNSKKLTFSKSYIKTFESKFLSTENSKKFGRAYSPSDIFYLEKIIKRIKKFRVRGMEFPDYDFSLVLENYFAELNIPDWLLSSFSRVQSCLLEDALDYGGHNTSKYKLKDIIYYLILEWINLHEGNQKDILLTRFLLSPSAIIRQVASDVVKDEIKKDYEVMTKDNKVINELLQD